MKFISTDTHTYLDLRRRRLLDHRSQDQLLADRDIPPLKRYLYVENARSSPLIALPAEIRNRIYGYVLQLGSLIHVNVRPCSPEDLGAWPLDWFDGAADHEELDDKCVKVTHTLCYCDPDIEDVAYKASLDPEATPRAKALREDDSVNRYDIRHFECNRAVPGNGKLIQGMSLSQHNNVFFHNPHPLRSRRLDLRLLNVCRQINRETALLPLSCNTFSLKHGNVLDFFVSRSLRGRQRSAISSLHLHDWLNGFNEDLQSFPGARTATIAMLHGVKKLHVLIPFATTNENEDFGKFADLPLTHVSVIVASKATIPAMVSAHCKARRWEHRLMMERSGAIVDSETT